MDELIVAVFAGNVLTLAFGWSLFQFHKHDYKAPWSAYAWFFIPLLFAGSVFFVTGELPPWLDAVAPR